MNNFFILVVEDVARDRAAAGHYLEKLGVSMRVVDNVMEAIIELNTRAYDIVLCSLDIPNEDVSSLVMCIRADRRLALIPVIGMSASITPFDPKYPLLEIDGMLQKPLNEIDFLALMRHWWMRLDAAGPAATRFSLSSNGIDSGGALKRLRGSVALYLKVLGWFEQKHASTILTLREALNAGAMERALWMLHDFRSLSGTIGAHALFEFLPTMEVAVRCGVKERIDAEFFQMEKIVQTTLVHIARYVAVHAAEA